MAAYYNEVDPHAAAWLRNLIRAGHIADGEVDDRSIEDVQPEDIRGFRQCHWFAGIAGWSLALRAAGWPDDREIWTGSPPCQDNSLAAAIHGGRVGLRGQRSGLAHVWLGHVERDRPRVVAFENVPGIGPWIAEVEGRLAGAGYRVRAPQRSSADIGAPHLRRREWRIADRDGAGLQEPRPAGPRAPFSDPRRTPPRDLWPSAPGGRGSLADGLPNRVACVRAAGNAIDPWVASAILREYMEEAAR